jgi:hypothetical protein
MLVRAGVRELSAAKNITNNKVGRGLLVTALKLCIMWSCVAKGEVQLSLDILLRKPVTGPLSKPRGAPVPLLIALPPVTGAEEWKPRLSNLFWWLWWLLLGR